MTKLLFFGVFVALNVCLVASSTPGLRVKYGLNPFVYGSQIFVDIPRELDEIIDEGWTQVPRVEDNPFLPTLSLYCPNQDYGLCAFFDDTGYIAGLQIAFPIDRLSNTILTDLSVVSYKKWTPPALSGESQQDYWINQQFYISESTLAKSSAERTALHPNGEVLYDGGLWIPEYGSETLQFISKSQTTFIENDPAWIKQGCYIFMGQHYFYNITTNSDCDSNFKPYSWFLLTDDSELHATGLYTYGKVANENGKKDWYEDATVGLVKAILPNANQCYYDLVETYGLTSVHVYYINNPITQLCL